MNEEEFKGWICLIYQFFLSGNNTHFMGSTVQLLIHETHSIWIYIINNM